MPRTRQNIVQRAKQRGCNTDSSIINNERLLPELQDGTLRNHQSQLGAWEDYVNDEFHEKGKQPSAYNLADLKGFMRVRAYAIKGTKNLPASVQTVRNYWNNFTGAWKRQYTAIPSDIAESVTEFIYGPLKDELSLLTEKKPRRFASENHLFLYAEQLWARDWFVYQKPETRVSDWGLHLSNVFSTSRIGEYIESSCRRGSDRGLYYKDVMFICFWNEYKRPELAIQLTKDAKNMSQLPISKRPRHALTEGKDPDLLCFNSLLPFLSKLLELKAFQDHETIEDLFAIQPPTHARACHVRWRDDILETPFFLSQSTTRAGRIETAGAFSRRIAELGIRVGMPEPPTQHDWRAEGLFKTDKHYSESIRMRQAGHQDSATFRRYYQPSNGGVDGQATFLGKERREVISDVFRELSIHYNPNLSQRLPAREKYKLERSKEYISLEEEIASLASDHDSESRDRLAKLQQDRRSLVNNSLKHWQMQQPYKADDPPEYHRGLFDRVRFMMPERDRLARDLFQIATLRDPLGLSVLRDLMALHRQSSEVQFRPGLEPDKCRCTKKREYYNDDIDPPSHNYNWKHIYDCYKKHSSTVYGSAELCFLCNKWIFGSQEWREHCCEHVNDLNTFPTYFDPLLHGGVLASPGFCPFCLVDTHLEPPDRMHQFLHRAKWLDHVQKHIEKLRHPKKSNENISLDCPLPGPQCPKRFACVLDLEFHLQDIHGADMLKRSGARKRSRETKRDVKPAQSKRQRRKYGQISEDLFFVNTTIDMMSNRSLKRSKDSPRDSSPSYDPEPANWRDIRANHPASTPLSSISDDDLIDPEILLHAKTASNIISNPTTQLELTDSDGRVPVFVAEARCTDFSVPSFSTVDATQILSTDEQDSAHLKRDIDPPAAVDPDDGQFIVERLVRKRVRRVGRCKKVQYLVKWEGYPHNENTWEDETDIHEDLIKALTG